MSKIFSSFLLEGFCDQILLFQSNFFIGEQGETILKSKNPDLIKKKFKLKKVTNLDNNILSILET